jgi:hypothetical protein
MVVIVRDARRAVGVKIPRPIHGAEREERARHGGEVLPVDADGRGSVLAVAP